MGKKIIRVRREELKQLEVVHKMIDRKLEERVDKDTLTFNRVSEKNFGENKGG